MHLLLSMAINANIDGEPSNMDSTTVHTVWWHLRFIWCLWYWLELTSPGWLTRYICKGLIQARRYITICSLPSSSYDSNIDCINIFWVGNLYKLAWWQRSCIFGISGISAILMIVLHGVCRVSCNTTKWWHFNVLMLDTSQIDWHIS